jgi:hypothetical protein
MPSRIIEAYPSLYLNHTLWSLEAGSGDRRMRGTHAWSFAFAIPPDVRIKGKDDHAPVSPARLVCHVRRIVLRVD